MELLFGSVIYINVIHITAILLCLPLTCTPGISFVPVPVELVHTIVHEKLCHLPQLNRRT